MANSVDPDQTAPIGAICSGSMLFASILNLPVMLHSYLQQMISAVVIFRCIFFLGALLKMSLKLPADDISIGALIPKIHCCAVYIQNCVPDYIYHGRIDYEP